MAPLRAHTLFSLNELGRVEELLLTALNEKPIHKLPGSRRSWFEEIEVLVLKPPRRNTTNTPSRVSP